MGKQNSKLGRNNSIWNITKPIDRTSYQSESVWKTSRNLSLGMLQLSGCRYGKDLYVAIQPSEVVKFSLMLSLFFNVWLSFSWALNTMYLELQLCDLIENTAPTWNALKYLGLKTEMCPLIIASHCRTKQLRKWTSFIPIWNSFNDQQFRIWLNIWIRVIWKLLRDW